MGRPRIFPRKKTRQALGVLTRMVLVVKNVLNVALVAASLLFCSGIALAATILTKAEVGPYLHAQSLIDIGGRRLNMYCSGHGSPAVILDAGAGDTTLSWRKVQPAISKFTRVCSYDRAGLGFSDGGPIPQDAKAAVHDLHALLQRAGVAPPYVLVGHSEAGFYEPLYADRYRQQVAGMVLVDPSFPNAGRDYDAVSPTAAREDASVANIFQRCYEGARNGGLKQGAVAYASCGFAPHWGARLDAQCAKRGHAWCELAHVQVQQAMRPVYWQDLGSELTSEARNSAEDIQSQRSFGPLPLIVLTAAYDDGQPPPVPRKEMAAVLRVTEKGHERLARLSTIGVDFIVHHSGHDIQDERQSVVISAIAEVLSQVRHERI